MKTYLMIWYNSDGGATPSEIKNRLMSLGFQPIQGPYDYVYDWGDNVDVYEILEFGDKVHLSLQDMGVIFKLETSEGYH